MSWRFSSRSNVRRLGFLSASRNFANLLADASPKTTVSHSRKAGSCPLASASASMLQDRCVYIDSFSSAEAHAAIVAASNSGDVARADLWRSRARHAGLLLDNALLDNRSLHNSMSLAPSTRERASSSSGARLTLTQGQDTDEDQPEPWTRLCADGLTPYEATVQAVRNYGAIVQMDVGYQALVPRAEFSSESDGEFKSLKRGDRVVTYIIKKNRDTQKISLSLNPRDARILSLKSVIADGLHPYQGEVSSCTSYGIFVDVGFERAVFIPTVTVDETFQNPSTVLGVGDAVTIYVTRKDEKTGKMTAAFQPRATASLLWKEVLADGQTPYQGKVIGIIDGQGAVVDIGCESLGFLHFSQTNQAQEINDLHVGAEIVVYVVGKERGLKRIFLSLERLAQPLLLWESVAADGQTPYRATVKRKIESGHYLVDIGCETLAMLPDHDKHVVNETVMVGDVVTVYIISKKWSTGRINVSTERRLEPLERYSAIIADGTTPYSGTVTAVCGHGTFVDIGCDLVGLLPKSSASLSRKSLLITSPPGAELQKGEKVTVYVWYKQSGKLALSLNSRSLPAVSVDQLVCDGVTPVQGTLLGFGDHVAWFDINCEVLGQVSFRDGTTDRSDLAALQLGMNIPVYVQRRNIVTKKVSLSLTPASSPKLQAVDVVCGSAYCGVVVQVQRCVAFIDFHCEVSGYLPERFGTEHIWSSEHGADAPNTVSLKCGDHVKVRASRYDAVSGRWQLAFDGFLKNPSTH